MNRLIMIFVLSFFTLSCKNKSNNLIPVGFKQVTFKLMDTIGKITMNIPSRYDTFMEWTDHSDCTCCEFEKYRFQSKTNPIYLESGFVYRLEPKDSIDMITISHSMCLYNHYKLKSLRFSEFNTLHQDRKKQDLDNLKDQGLISDTVLNINSQFYSVFIFIRFDTINLQTTKIFEANTMFNNNWITIKNNLLTNKKDSVNITFIENAKMMLASINFKQ